MCRTSKRLVTMSEHRGHKQHEIQDISDVVHDFSNLPDCILHQILSLMPTKEAVKTSVLSTRWKNLWAFLPNIDLDDELLCAGEVNDVTSFVNFVESVLRLWDAPNTEKFRLSCRVFRDSSIIHSWISHAIMHNVRELDICLREVDPSVIPPSMFDSTSIVSLKIRMDCAIQPPSHVSFPHLKTLQLSCVQFLHHDFTQKLFSGCPVLEELVLSDCKWMNLKNIAISSSTLKRLTIRDMFMFGPYEDPTSGCKIKIDAENLTYFEYAGYLSNEIILNNVSSLEKSFIDIPDPDWRRLNEVASRAIHLLKQLQYVVSLSLSNHTLKTLLHADNIRFPVFPNLTHLMLIMEIGMNHTCTVMMGSHSFCPPLQSICFCEGFIRFMRFIYLAENNSIWPSMPICISNCLKTVTLENFHGYNSEICILKRILKYARALERMDIRWSETYRDEKRKIKVKKELEKVERKAAACVIKVS